MVITYYKYSMHLSLGQFPQANFFSLVYVYVYAPVGMGSVHDECANFRKGHFDTVRCKYQEVDLKPHYMKPRSPSWASWDFWELTKLLLTESTAGHSL